MVNMLLQTPDFIPHLRTLLRKRVPTVHFHLRQKKGCRTTSSFLLAVAEVHVASANCGRWSQAMVIRALHSVCYMRVLLHTSKC